MTTTVAAVPVRVPGPRAWLERLPIPRPRLLAILLVACVPLALGGFSVAFVWLALLIAVGAIGLALLDLRATPRVSRIEVARIAETQLSLGARNQVALRLRSPFARPLRLLVRDEVPASFDVDRRVIGVDIPGVGAPVREARVGPPASEARAGAPASAAGEGEAEVVYVARPRYRGSFAFGDVHVRVRGPLDLVERQGRLPAAAPANVYPDLREIRRYEVTLRRGLAYDAGQRRARIPGAGSVFERLREYQPDDDPRAISWKATARRGRPISVEYETERQQRVLVLLDAGRMMSSTLGGLTKLDHAVNTALMLAYVAIGKGDEVGLLGFADEVRSYLVPRRGRPQFLRVAEELRRLEVTTTEPDHRGAFEFLRVRAGRRALVVLFTDLVSEDASRSLVAAVTRLARRDLVLCCLLADPQLAEAATRVPDSTSGVYERAVAQEVLEARATAIATLRRHGVHVIDVAAERLTVATIQRYLELKKRWL